MHGYTYDFNGAVNGHTLAYENSKEAVIQSNEQYAYSYRGLLRRAYTHQFVSGAFKDWRYRYSASGEREEKRLYDANANDSAMKYPWVYYLLGGGNAQLVVYHGQQTRKTMCGDSGRRVYMYPVEYLTYGAGGTANVLTLPNGSKQYVVADHLGSVRTVVDGTGTIATSDYAPFGGPIAATGAASRKSFIDKEIDRETGEGNFGARQYDPASGRFFAADPLLESYRTLSPYHYAGNNPLRILDPSGMGGDSVEADPEPEPTRGETPDEDTEPTNLPSKPKRETLTPEGESADPDPVEPAKSMSAADLAKEAAKDAQKYPYKNMERESNPENKPTGFIPRDANGKPLPLRRDPNGNLIPESEYPHTQLGGAEGRKGPYRQAVEFGPNGEPISRTDFTDHGRPNEHTNPHVHMAVPNTPGTAATSTGGSFRWGPGIPIPQP